MINILNNEEALRCHHSVIWIKRSASGEAEVITVTKPKDGESGAYVKLKVRYGTSDFESILLECANSGLTVEEFSNSPGVGVMDRHRIKIIACQHLARTEA